MFKKIVGILILLIILIISLELWLNFSHYQTEVLLQHQPEFGWSHLANNNFWYQDNLFFINQDGFRDINHALEKPAGVIRVGFVGSHYLRGTNSKFENIATTILEKTWNSNNPNQQIEVFNFAVPKYNLAMAHFLIKKFSQQYDIDYFLYNFDPQKDAMVIAGNSDIINYGPSFTFDDSGNIKENLNFTITPASATGHKSFKTYQLLRITYHTLKQRFSKPETESVGDVGSSLYQPYPQIYFDQVSTSTVEVIFKMAKMIDYMIDNNSSQVYILMLPPQHSQFFAEYETIGNLDKFYSNQKFVDFVNKIHGKDIENFMAGILFFTDQGTNNHFSADNLFNRFNDLVKNSDRLIEIDATFMKYLDDPGADGFLHNWHRRDSGQAYLAEILRQDVLTDLLIDQN